MITVANRLYTGNLEILANAFLKKDTLLGRERIKQERNKLNCCIEYNNEIFGYEIRENKPLTELYGFRVRVVDFEFSQINEVSSITENQILEELFQNLQRTIKRENAYYTFRVPTAVMSVLKMVNKYFDNILVCGGLISYVTATSVEMREVEDVKISLVSNDYLEKNLYELTSIARKSFETYRGQYHISPVTENRAGEIYSDWVYRSFNSENEKCFVSEYKGKPAGYVIVREDEQLCEGVLAVVSETYRRLGIYKNLHRNVINYACGKHKMFASVTQFENLVPQNTWISLGMRPFTSHYNIHIDMRD